MSPAPWDERVFLIAEAGVNHDGDLEKAFALIDAAAEAGADAVKFQTWIPGEIVGRFTHKVAYLARSTAPAESFYELAERLRLSFDDTARLKARCDERGVLFMSTPEGFDSLRFLTGALAMEVVKIGSAEVNHSAFLEAAGAVGRPVILSTGASTLTEAERGAAAVRRGSQDRAPLAVLHCVSEYPAPDADMNLRAMTALAGLGGAIGLSDHSLGTEASIAAVAMGARVIEKHLTLDCNDQGPDHAASMEPDAFAEMTRSIRRVEAMLGDGVKWPQSSEAKNLSGIRRSVVALRALPEAATLERGDLGCKRPATGAPPDDLERFVGRQLKRPVELDEPLDWADVEGGAG